MRIRNQAANVSQLQQSLDRLEVAYEGGATRRGDVDRTRQSLYDSQSGLLALNASYETRLDTYKISMGVPPDLDVRIEDPLLAKFDLISPKLTETRNTVMELLKRLRTQLDQGQLVPEQQFGELTTIRQDATNELQIVANDMRRLEQALPDRREVFVAWPSARTFDGARSIDRFATWMRWMPASRRFRPTTPPFRTSSAALCSSWRRSHQRPRLPRPKGRRRRRPVARC